MSYLFDEIYEKDGTDKSEQNQNKIVIMGLQAAGKTAIKDLIFFGKSEKDVENYMATTHYTRHFLDEEKKNVVIDSGGQESYFNEAVTYYRHLIFADAKLLIWVVDVSRPDLFEESERRFSFTIRQFKKENPNGLIYVFCHKTDLIESDKLDSVVKYLKDTINDPKFEIHFKQTTIYNKEELFETCKEILEEANINMQNLELISNIEGDEEFAKDQISFVAETDSDQKIQLLSKFLAEKPKSKLPTFGKLEADVDLSKYNIIEIVLLDKETLSPSLGASSHAIADTNSSMDYLLALNNFKKTIKEKGSTIKSYESIIDSYNSKVWASIYNIKHYYLLITSFLKITEERDKEFEDLILGFAHITQEKEKSAIAKQETEQETVSELEKEKLVESETIKEIETEEVVKVTEEVDDQLTETDKEEAISKLREEHDFDEQIEEKEEHEIIKPHMEQVEKISIESELREKFEKALKEADLEKLKEDAETTAREEITSEEGSNIKTEGVKGSLISFSADEITGIVNFFGKTKKEDKQEINTKKE